MVWTSTKQSAYYKEWAADNRDKLRPLAAKRMAMWRKDNPNGPRQAWLKKKYGITLSAFDSLWAIQGYKCAICQRPKPDTEKVHWHVDHNHETGKVRGILCPSCNKGLGDFRDNQEILLRAIEYLKNTESVLCQDLSAHSV